MRTGSLAGPAEAGITSFDFQPRTRVVFGNGSLAQLGKLARTLARRRAMVVSDPGIVSVGYPEAALRFLETEGISAVVFSEVEENPTTAHVDAGLAFAKEHDIDLIIGLGGGVQPTPKRRIRCVVMKICVMSVATWASMSSCAKLPTRWLNVSVAPKIMLACVK